MMIEKIIKFLDSDSAFKDLCKDVRINHEINEKNN